MTVTVELTAEVERVIERKARRLGLSASEYLSQIAEKAARPSKPRQRLSANRPLSGAETLDQLKAMNLPKGYGDSTVDSPELARQLSAQFSRPHRDASH